MKKALTIVLLIVTCIYLLLWVSPFFVKGHFNANSKDLIGRKASVESLSFNPFTCTLRAKGFLVWEKDDESVFAGFKQLDINLNFLKAITGVYQVELINLDSPYVKVISYGDSFNFDDLVAEDSLAEEESKDSVPAVAFEILNLTLSKGDIIFFDSVREHQIELDELTFLLPRFAYDSHSASMDLSLLINESGKLRIANEFFPTQNRTETQLYLQNLDLHIIRPYLTDFLQFNELRGTFGADLKIHSDFRDETNINIVGGSWVSGVEFTDSASVPYLGVDSLYTYMQDIDVFGNEYRIGQVLLNGFFLRYDAWDSTSSLEEGLAPLLASLESGEGSEQDSIAGDTVSKIFYSVDTVLMVNSDIDYNDYTLDEPFSYKITEIMAVANNISSDSSVARFSSNGILNEVGKYNANLIMPVTDPLNFDLDFTVEGFQMDDISPFTITYAGHPIFTGNLMYTGHTVVVDGMMQSENKAIIYDLEVGDKAKGNFLLSVPLKFAVFLLKDKNGVVNLDIPLEGNMADPKFKVGPLILQIIKQNLEKAVAAPGKILASQYGIDPKEIEYIAFDPLDTVLTSAGENTIMKLGELLEKKQGLAVELAYYEPSNIEAQTYAYNAAKERYVKARLKYRIEDEFRNLVNKTDDRDLHFVNYMNEELGTNSSNADSLAMALVGVDVAIAKTRVLRGQRENAIRSFIAQKSQLNEGSFKFSDAEQVPDFPTEGSGFVIEFGMK